MSLPQKKRLPHVMDHATRERGQPEVSGRDRPSPEGPYQRAPQERGRVEVQILGQRMLLKSGDDPRHLERLANFVKRKVDEVAAHGPVSSSKLAVLAALNIADDYFRALDEAREFKREVANRSRELLKELDG